MTWCEVPADRPRLADMSDFAAVQRAVEGGDIVVHLAARELRQISRPSLTPSA
jgi:nucleoside-diphosphate-sugar epimerase